MTLAFTSKKRQRMLSIVLLIILRLTSPDMGQALEDKITLESVM